MLRWEDSQHSENLEDRRRIGPTDGGGRPLLLALGIVFGVDPQKPNAMFGEAQVGANPNAKTLENVTHCTSKQGLH